ncbi:hypothetical protein EFZ10_10810 [Tatumella sp. TA1]|nr:hypothetical protein EFZ10_10810 [Tatumella sp. TA1]
MLSKIITILYKVLFYLVVGITLVNPHSSAATALAMLIWCGVIISSTLVIFLMMASSDKELRFKTSIAKNLQSRCFISEFLGLACIVLISAALWVSGWTYTTLCYLAISMFVRAFRYFLPRSTFV